MDGDEGIEDKDKGIHYVWVEHEVLHYVRAAVYEFSPVGMNMYAYMNCLPPHSSHEECVEQQERSECSRKS